MEVKILRSYNDSPFFSSRDSFYEALINNEIQIRFVKCDDKHSSHLGEIAILEVDGNLKDPQSVLQDLELDSDTLIARLDQALEHRQ